MADEKKTAESDSEPRTGCKAQALESGGANKAKTDKPKRSIGRPRKGDAPLTVNLQVRVSQQVAALCKSLGGADFLRPVIEAAAAEGAALAREEDVRGVARRAARRFMPAIYRPATNDPTLTFVDMGAQCGFPSPAFDYAAQELSLTDYFVKHPDATYIVQAAGDSMIDAGIEEGDILMIDRSLEPKPGDIVLAVLNGEFTVKRLKVVAGKPELHPENAAADYPVIRPGEFDAFQIEGVLVGSGRRYRR